ncbi:hypothetical protein U1Q18_036715 [Sarracenia purpurea var. burkii]
MDKNREEEHEIVIVGGGLCGLATALALHRKGMRSVVLERAETLRASGGALGIFANGWRALHQLGIASHLIQLGRPIHSEYSVEKVKKQRSSFVRVFCSFWSLDVILWGFGHEPEDLGLARASVGVELAF